jgi:hypothetical protein
LLFALTRFQNYPLVRREIFFDRQLEMVQMSVSALESQKVLGPAFFGNASLVQNNDLVVEPDSAQPMRDD